MIRDNYYCLFGGVWVIGMVIPVPGQAKGEGWDKKGGVGEGKGGSRGGRGSGAGQSPPQWGPGSLGNNNKVAGKVQGTMSTTTTMSPTPG